MKHWPLKVFFISLLLAGIFSTLSTLCADLNTITLVIILILVIFIGILFDMIGVSVLTSKESTFHAMSSKKIPGSKESLTLLKNNSAVSSFCNDVIGDICGIVSGSLGTVLTSYLIIKYNTHLLWTTVLVTALISAITVGGKALGKEIAIKKSDKIIFTVGKIKHLLHLK